LARPLPDWTKVREELARRDHQVTLALLWEEYKAENPGDYQYSQFAELYRRFEKRLSVVLRQPHRSAIATLAPSAATSLANASPIPDAPPVTTTLLPANRAVMMLNSSSSLTLLARQRCGVIAINYSLPEIVDFRAYGRTKLHGGLRRDDGETPARSGQHNDSSELRT
jgi:hypothetical protein